MKAAGRMAATVADRRSTRSPIATRWPRAKCSSAATRSLATPAPSIPSRSCKKRPTRGGIDVGDLLSFNIQGVPLEATVNEYPQAGCGVGAALLRLRLCAGRAARRAADDLHRRARCAGRDRRAAKPHGRAFPNVTVIDVTATIAQFAVVVQRITQVVRFFSALQHSGRPADRGQLGLCDAAGARAGGRLLQGARRHGPLGDRRLCAGKSAARPAQRRAGAVDGADGGAGRS